MSAFADFESTFEKVFTSCALVAASAAAQSSGAEIASVSHTRKTLRRSSPPEFSNGDSSVILIYIAL